MLPLQGIVHGDEQEQAKMWEASWCADSFATVHAEDSQSYTCSMEHTHPFVWCEQVGGINS